MGEIAEKLLEVQSLKKYFPVKDGFFKTNDIKAVDDAVSYTHLTLPTKRIV